MIVNPVSMCAQIMFSASSGGSCFLVDLFCPNRVARSRTDFYVIFLLWCCSSQFEFLFVEGIFHLSIIQNLWDGSEKSEREQREIFWVIYFMAARRTKLYGCACCVVCTYKVFVLNILLAMLCWMPYIAVATYTLVVWTES